MTLVRTCLLGTTALFLTAAGAYAQEACNNYTVVAGDNLRSIARDAYGDADMYRVIYSANIDTIGETADLIEVGANLAIPCKSSPDATAETAAVTTTAEPAVTVASEAAQATAKPDAEAIKIVTGNGYAPFADEMLPGGGMFTQVVEMAVFRADPDQAYSLTFINDWQAHIDALLPSGAYDLSFPWVRPNCEAPDALSTGDRTRCEDFVFSAPAYEIVDGFFALSDSGLASVPEFAGLAGKRICRPEGYTTGVLDAVGLTVPTIELVRPVDIEDCFDALVAGEADLVSIDTAVGDAVIAKHGLADKVVVNPHLSTIESLHIIAHKSNQRAVDMIAKLDVGIGEMAKSGEWYDIVSAALLQTNEQNQ
jgi:ABC-type amino acid transport substrate-binding protein